MKLSKSPLCHFYLHENPFETFNSYGVEKYHMLPKHKIERRNNQANFKSNNLQEHMLTHHGHGSDNINHTFDEVIPVSDTFVNEFIDNPDMEIGYDDLKDYCLPFMTVKQLEYQRILHHRELKMKEVMRNLIRSGKSPKMLSWEEL